MPTLPIGSVTIHAEAFLTHWQQVNATLAARTGAKPLTLRGDYTRDDFAADRTAVDTATRTAWDWARTRRYNAKRREQVKRDLLPRFIQFRAAVRSALPGTVYTALVPPIPVITSAETRILDALEDLNRVWTRIDAETNLAGFTPPLLLADDYTRADFVTDCATLSGVYRGVTGTSTEAGVARKARKKQGDALVERMRQYRAAVTARFAADHPLVTSLPMVSSRARRRNANATPEAAKHSVALELVTTPPAPTPQSETPPAPLLAATG